MCCLANTSDGAPHANKSLICIPMDTPGVTVAKKIDKLGMWSSDTVQVRDDREHLQSKMAFGGSFCDTTSIVTTMYL